MDKLELLDIIHRWEYSKEVKKTNKLNVIRKHLVWSVNYTIF